MRKSLLLVAVAALSITACTREGGSEKETNKTEENGNSASEDEGRDSRDDRNRDEEGTRDEGSRDEGNRDDRESGSRGDDEGGSSDQRGGGDEAELREALEQAAREQRRRLPLRDGITTVYDAEADGTDFIVSLRIDQDFSDEQFEQLERGFQRETCNGDSAELIRLGATTVYRVTDSEGERRTYRISSC